MSMGGSYRRRRLVRVRGCRVNDPYQHIITRTAHREALIVRGTRYDVVLPGPHSLSQWPAGSYSRVKARRGCTEKIRRGQPHPPRPSG
jgi:hypothetical protein